MSEEKKRRSRALEPHPFAASRWVPSYCRTCGQWKKLPCHGATKRQKR